MKYVFIFILFTNSLFANEDKFKEKAQEILNPIKKAFMGELKTGMQEGPYNAIEMCHLKAPHLIEYDQADKYEIGRTSNKIRNKDNAPKDWMKDILKEYQDSNAESAKAAAVFKVLDNKKVYVEPIYVKGLCLNCHGNARGSVAKKIKKLYPNDQATGYKIGEFRGLFYVKEK
tara:strand:+ start:289752 stop:290270 length:519 start_codon:yes stop_codon:yes gene_type:complete